MQGDVIKKRGSSSGGGVEHGDLRSYVVDRRLAHCFFRQQVCCTRWFDVSMCVVDASCLSENVLYTLLEAISAAAL